MVQTRPLIDIETSAWLAHQPGPRLIDSNDRGERGKGNMKRFTIGLVVVFAMVVLVFGCDNSEKKSNEESDIGRDSGSEYDSGPTLCAGDPECSDGLFCNGEERCNPGAEGADERGCVNAESGPCAEGTSCDEATDKCVSCTDNADL
jgi:hypothetical protein